MTLIKHWPITSETQVLSDTTSLTTGHHPSYKLVIKNLVPTSPGTACYIDLWPGNLFGPDADWAVTWVSPGISGSENDLRPFGRIADFVDAVGVNGTMTLHSPQGGAAGIIADGTFTNGELTETVTNLFIHPIATQFSISFRDGNILSGDVYVYGE